MNRDPVFCFDDITGGYGRMMIVRGVSGRLWPGECLCVMGRNGVGKSTLMKLLSGHLPLASGTVVLDGVEIGNQPAEARQWAGLNYSMQENAVFNDLSVKENLTLMRRTDELSGLAQFFTAFPIIRKRLSQRAGTLSGGERKILSFVRAMSEHGKILMLDEPTEGVQPENIDRMVEAINTAKSNGNALLIVEQNIDFVLGVADRICVMDRGKAILTRDREEVDRATLLVRLTV